MFGLRKPVKEGRKAPIGEQCLALFAYFVKYKLRNGRDNRLIK